ncbi:MAG: hypothetical protein KJN79_00580 [Gammaproteobacteria bacterium]|nr:hypothetical protein [Gammaproteobacteria bacterium]
MVRLHHRFRRDGGINIRGTWYELDKSGCIEASQEHAAVVLQGAMWREVERRAALVPPPPPPPESPTAGPQQAAPPKLEDMSRAALAELARGLGVEVDGRSGKLKLVSLIREAQKKES